MCNDRHAAQMAQISAKIAQCRAEDLLRCERNVEYDTWGWGTQGALAIVRRSRASDGFYDVKQVAVVAVPECQE